MRSSAADRREPADGPAARRGGRSAIPGPRTLFCVDDNFADQPRPRRAGLALTRPGVIAGLLVGGSLDDVFITAADPAALVCGGAQVILPRGCEQLDVGVCLVAVVGATEPTEPPQIAGYAVGLDFVRRDVPATQAFLARSFPTHKVRSAATTPAARIRLDAGTTLTLRVDGEARQHSAVGQMIATPQQLLARIASSGAVRAGDLIFTGSPAGTALDTGRGWLRAGSVVVGEIDGLGLVRATVVDEDGDR